MQLIYKELDCLRVNIKLSLVDPSRAEPSRAEPSRTEPRRTAQKAGILFRIKTKLEVEFGKNRLMHFIKFSSRTFSNFYQVQGQKNGQISHQFDY